MNRQLTDDEVNSFEDKCRRAEALLEEIGRDICSVEGGGLSWRAINCAVDSVQEAIHNSHTMRPGCNRY